MKKLLSVLISAVLLFSSIISVSAEDDYTLVYITAVSSATQSTDILELLEHNGEIYIESQKAATLSNTNITKSFNNIISFENGYFKVDYTDKIISYEGKLYCKLKELMNMLRTRYEYVQNSETLLFKHCTAFQENLYIECEKIIRENKPYDFEVNFLDNVYGVGLATVYNVLKGIRFDYLWGGYQQEQYEKAFANIIKGPENESDLLNLVSDGANIMSDFSTLLELGETQGVYELFGLPYDDIIEIYNVYNKVVPGTGIKDAAEIAQLVYTSQNAYETYANAVYYGAVKNKADASLGDAADYIYSYYRGNAPTALSVYGKVLDNYSTDKIEDIAKESLGIKSVYIKAAGLVLDALFGIDNKTSATEQAEICAEIQTVAFDSYNIGCHNYGKRYLDAKNATPELLNEAILQIKYSTILYLRACQYAFSNLKSEKGMKSMAEFWDDAASEAIQTVASYEDADLIYVAENDDVKLEWCSESLVPSVSWYVEPTIDAEDIKPCLFDREVVFCEINCDNMPTDDNYSLIKRNGLYGIIDYSGNTVLDCSFQKCWVGPCTYSWCYDGYNQDDFTECDYEYFAENYGNYYNFDKRFSMIMMDEEDLYFGVVSTNHIACEIDGDILYPVGTLEPLSCIYSCNVPVPVCVYEDLVERNDYGYKYYIEENFLGYTLSDGKKPISNIIYDYMGSYSCGLIPAQKGSKWGFLNGKGEVVLPFEFDGCTDFYNSWLDLSVKMPYNATYGTIVLHKNNQYALYDTSGNCIIDFGEYEELRPVYQDKLWAKQNGKWGVLQLNRQLCDTQTGYSLKETYTDLLNGEVLW